MLDVEAIHTYYGDSHVLHGVSLRVAPGEAVALLGRNGAGKTTAIRSIVGFTPPRAGRVVFEGRAIERWPSYRIARSGLALVPQGRRIFAPLSVRENLLLGARAQGWTLERVFALFPRLREREQQSGGTLSGGEQQMLAIGRALLTNAACILLDEPSEGLAPLIVREIGRILARAQGGAPVAPAGRAELPPGAAGGRPRLRDEQGADRLRGDARGARGGRGGEAAVPGRGVSLRGGGRGGAGSA